MTPSVLGSVIRSGQAVKQEFSAVPDQIVCHLRVTRTDGFGNKETPAGGFQSQSKREAGRQEEIESERSSYPVPWLKISLPGEKDT